MQRLGLETSPHCLLRRRPTALTAAVGAGLVVLPLVALPENIGQYKVTKRTA